MLRPGVKYLGKRPAPTPPAVRFGDNDIERIIFGEDQRFGHFFAV